MKYLFVIYFTFLSFLTFAQNKTELRAAWLTTVANIDWPMPNNFDSEKQKEEMVSILDSLQRLNINTIYFQIRPLSDAFYYSDFEPWSRFLTGEQNKAPEAFYDPLAFVIKESHERFIDVHVWINPYRVSLSEDTSLLHKDHLFFRRPDMFVKYGNKYYFNPGLEETRVYLCDVVKDIVSRYNIDGVHFDDYFYPYKLQGEIFPDYETYMYDSKGFECIEDWRRNNVNLIIQELSTLIKQIKPWVEFGISPFGVWRNETDDIKGSKTNASQTNYDDLYADILLWLKNDWIDYVVPQLYWEIGMKVADYSILLDWWSMNSYEKKLYIGLAPYKLGLKTNDAWNTPNEICRQLRLNEEYNNISGVAYFSTKPLLSNKQGLCDSLITKYYKYQAIPPSVFPESRNLQIPTNLRIEKMGNRPYLFWDDTKSIDGEAISYYVVYMFSTLSEVDINNPKYIYKKTLDNCIDLSDLSERNKSSIFVVTSVNRFKKESINNNYFQYYY